MGELTPALYCAGEGEPLVLVHGFTGTWRNWRPVLAELVTKFEVIAPTLAGHAGGPPLPAGAHSLSDAADSLEGQLDELGVGTAHLAGNSMGGALALELARRGRARSVVALSPGGGWDPSSKQALRVARFFARLTWLTRSTREQLPVVMSRAGSRRVALREVMRCGHLVSPADALEMALDSLACTAVDEVLRVLRTGGDAALPQRLAEIDTPVLIAWAQYDRILPLRTCSERFRREIPGVQFRVLPGVGHVPMWDDTRLVTATIADWASRHAGALQPTAA